MCQDVQNPPKQKACRHGSEAGEKSWQRESPPSELFPERTEWKGEGVRERHVGQCRAQVELPRGAIASRRRTASH